MESTDRMSKHRMESWGQVQGQWRDAMIEFIGSGDAPDRAVERCEVLVAEQGRFFSDSQRDFLVISVGG